MKTNPNSNEFEPGWFIVHVYHRSRTSVEAVLDDSEAEIIVNIASKLNEQIVKTYDSDSKKISEYRVAEQLVRCVELNIADFADVIMAQAENFYEQRTITPEQMEVFGIQVSRTFMNVMSMFRSFLNHADTYLARNFGNHSDELKFWQDQQKREYDQVFSYRFFYKLRNYLQHVDSPPLEFKFSSSAKADSVEMRVDLSRDRLLEAKNVFKREVVEDLKKQPRLIPLHDLMEDWVKCFERLSQSYLASRAREARCGAQRMLNLRESIGEDFGTVNLAWLNSGDVTSDAFSMSLKLIPERTAKAIMEMVKKGRFVVRS